MTKYIKADSFFTPMKLREAVFWKLQMAVLDNGRAKCRRKPILLTVQAIQ